MSSAMDCPRRYHRSSPFGSSFSASRRSPPCSRCNSPVVYHDTVVGSSSTTGQPDHACNGFVAICAPCHETVAALTSAMMLLRRLDDCARQQNSSRAPANTQRTYTDFLQ